MDDHVTRSEMNLAMRMVELGLLALMLMQMWYGCEFDNRFKAIEQKQSAGK